MILQVQLITKNDDLADVFQIGTNQSNGSRRNYPKYGQPNGVTVDELIWTNAGIWKK
jgi:hypothetical protein